MALSSNNGYLTSTTNYNSSGTSGGTTGSSNTGTSSSTTSTTNTPTLTGQGNMYANMLSSGASNNTPVYNNYTAPSTVSYNSAAVPSLTTSQYASSPSLLSASNVRGAQDISKYLNSASSLIKQGATGTTDYANNVINALTQQYQQNLPKTIGQLAPQLTGLGSGLSQKLLSESVANALSDLGVNTSNTLLDAYNTQKANELSAGSAMGNLAGYVNQASGINTQADTATNAAKAALNNALTQLYGQNSTNTTNANQQAIDTWAKLLANNQATSQGQLAAQVSNNEATNSLNNILLGQNQLANNVYGTQVGSENARNALYASLAQALIQNQQTQEQSGTTTGTSTGTQSGTSGSQGTQTTQTPNPLAGIDWASIMGGGTGTPTSGQSAQNLLNSYSGNLNLPKTTNTGTIEYNPYFGGIDTSSSYLADYLS